MTVRRRVNTSRKSIRLTDDGRAKIQAWADEQGVSFSAAIERFSRLGMGEPAVSFFLEVANKVSELVGSTASHVHSSGRVRTTVPRNTSASGSPPMGPNCRTRANSLWPYWLSNFCQLARR